MDKTMSSFSNIEKNGKYYTTAERDSLNSGNYEDAAELCRGRHSEKGIYMAFSRAMDSKLAVNGIPKSLNRLIIKLGLQYYRPPTPSPVGYKKFPGRQNEILKYLASLPNAENYQEEHWLDTPELWPFVDPDKIRYLRGESCADLRKALLTRMDSWCDRWIPFSDTAFSVPAVFPESLYLFPFPAELNDRDMPRSRKKYVAEHTFLALSQADGKREQKKISRSKASGILEWKGRMSIGYISFRFGVPVADVIDIINSGSGNEPEKL
jgi:hypothetical protein